VPQLVLLFHQVDLVDDDFVGVNWIGEARSLDDKAIEYVSTVSYR